MVYQALYEGFDRIHLAGFDFGGGHVAVADPDYQQYGGNWVNQFKEIIRETNCLDKLVFIGEDKKCILE
jgi:hypothetical protein